VGIKKILNSKRTKHFGFLVLAVGFLVLSGFLIYAFIDLLNNTSYRFVAIFVSLILLSNILAKVAIKYIEVK
jgi:hypothetical protein